MLYNYVTVNNLEMRQNYMYSEYGGMDFLSEYVSVRNKYIANLEKVFEDIKTTSLNLSHTGYRLKVLLQKILEHSYGEEEDRELNFFIKAFEIRKRIHDEYVNGKPKENDSYMTVDNYILFAECLLAVYRDRGCLKEFSCLLKTTDTLLSIDNLLDWIQKERLGKVLEEELSECYKLLQKNGLTEVV